MRHWKLLALTILLVAGALTVLAWPTKPVIVKGVQTKEKQPRIKLGLDLQGGSSVVLQAQTEELKGRKWTQEDLNTVIRIIRTRVDKIGVAEPIIQPKGIDQIVVEMPGVSDEEILSTLKTTARLEFRHFVAISDSAGDPGKYRMTRTTSDDGKEVYTFTDSLTGDEVPAAKIIEESPLILTGDDLRPTATGAYNQSKAQPVVDVEFQDEGRKKFAAFTRKNVGEYLAIVLEDEILQVPTIQEAILDGHAEISGFSSPEEAQWLADMLNAGALPVPLTVVQQQVVEATIGKVAVDQSMKAAILGIGLVVVFMVLYYLLPGLIADLALVIYALLTLAVFRLAGVTLTLPGIAAFILSVGMAVDANILIFERLKEELRNGKTLRAAIDAGFSRALTSIIDSNTCTLITCLILFFLGSGPVKGFAVVLGLGVLISMFTAITVSRTLLHLIVNTSLGEKAGLFGLRRQWVTGKTDHQVNIVGRMKVWFALSAVVLIPGLIFLAKGDLKKGIDFTGGSFLQVQFQQPADSDQISSTLEGIGLGEPMVQKATDDPTMAFVRTKEITPEKAAEVEDALAAIGGNIVQEDSVGGVISKELTTNAFKAIILSSILIVLYLSVRFAIGGIAQGFRFGACAVLATLHDVGVIVGIFAILGAVLNWEIDSLFVTALLTVIGFSTHDTIVIFDRIRENLRHKAKGESFDDLVNRSILQSFARSINTSLTVVLTLVALLIFVSAHSVQHFIWALLIGIITGTYSSIFNASQLLVLWQRLTNRDVTGKVVDPTRNVSSRERELKPLVDTGVETFGSEVEAGAADDTGSTATKVKAKKRNKRRY